MMLKRSIMFSTNTINIKTAAQLLTKDLRLKTKNNFLHNLKKASIAQNSALQKGYTLIELLVVIAVIGILASVTIAAVNPLRNINQAKDSDTKSDISSISTAMQTHYTNSGTSGTSTYPNSISGLIPSELKVEPKMYDGSSYTILVDPPGCLGTDDSSCTDVAIYGALL